MFLLAADRMWQQDLIILGDWSDENSCLSPGYVGRLCQQSGA